MGNPNFSTEHRKGQHLTEEERHDIEVHLADLMNALPRKILGYHTAEELFEKEPDRSYAA